MSTLKTDIITNQAGTGAPDFPNGLTFTNGGEIASGSYTPVISNKTGIGTVTNEAGHYMRVGTVVTVTFSADIDFDTTTQFDWEVSLPIASNFTLLSDACGTFIINEGQLAGFEGRIFASVANDTARFESEHTNTGNRVVTATFTYVIK